MTTPRNPFKATLGATPPLLVGREEVIRTFGFALDDGPGAHERVSLIIGPRGIGKTVLLNAFEAEAHERGWFVLSETATNGFVERLRNTVIRELAQHRSRLKGLSLSILGFGGGVTWDTPAIIDSSYSLRNALDDFLEYKSALDRDARQEESGILITLDEMHHQRSTELIEFGVTIQHLVRESKNIAVAMAGIPSSIKPLLSGKRLEREDPNPITFLRRAERVELGRVSDADVRKALEEPLTAVGTAWLPEALDHAVEACRGYPFMIQLVGQWAFREKEGNEITLEASRRGVERARRKLGQLVHEPALADLSDVDRTFLLLMARDDGPTAMADLKVRMNRTDSYVSNYRRRLIDAEMITEAGRGKIDFALPYLRDYLRAHAASLVTEAEM